MSVPDKYSGFSELAQSEREGVDFQVTITDRGSNLVVVAPHGGAIEPGTSEIALAVASDRYSCCLFEGVKTSNNGELHITSTSFDEPRCLKLIATSMTALTLHGEGSMREVVFVGGRDYRTGTRLRQSFKEYGFNVATHSNPALLGKSAENICNRGKLGMGIQLEISNGLRRKFFQSLDSEGRRLKTALFWDFVAAVTAVYGPR
ncbi:MAG: poly-gamma-glutamate hydrolase family protein [bacterium]